MADRQNQTILFSVFSSAISDGFFFSAAAATKESTMTFVSASNVAAVTLTPHERPWII